MFNFLIQSNRTNINIKSNIEKYLKHAIFLIFSLTSLLYLSLEKYMVKYQYANGLIFFLMLESYFYLYLNNP